MLSELKKGDDVSTQGGIIGKISGMKDGEVTLQLQEGVRVRVLRSAITGVYTGATPGAKPESKSEAKAS
jgi:preprotein translocase subunit YajC